MSQNKIHDDLSTRNSNTENVDKKKKSKEFQITKRAAKKLKLQERISNSLQNSLLTTKKKLLIFDLNKVLICRIPRTSFYEFRPYVHEFLKAMSTVYDLAVWTSMKRNTAKRIVSLLFHVERNNSDNEISTETKTSSSSHSDLPPLLFEWYQNKCTHINTPPPSQSSPESTNHNVNNSTHSKNQNNQNTNCTEERGILSKDLRNVWKEYPTFHQFNTILLDDSPEKCLANPPHTVVHPFAYDYDHHSNSVLYKGIDIELKPSGPLCMYLIDIAQQMTAAVDACGMTDLLSSMTVVPDSTNSKSSGNDSSSSSGSRRITRSVSKRTNTSLSAAVSAMQSRPPYRSPMHSLVQQHHQQRQQHRHHHHYYNPPHQQELSVHDRNHHHHHNSHYQQQQQQQQHCTKDVNEIPLDDM